MRRLPGSHAPNIKNRSSKHLNLLLGHKPAVRSQSNATLQKWAQGDKDGKNKCWPAVNELNRRDKKRIKKDAKV